MVQCIALNKPNETISFINESGVFIEREQMVPEKPSRTVGYLRVSKDTQDLDKNRADILILANKEDLGRVEFVEEKVSGKIPWRKRRIAAVLGELREGDALIVSELSRLGRSMLECIEILSIASAAGIRVYAIKGA